MGDVIQLNMATTADLPAADVLNGAAEADLSSVIIIGETKAGKTYFATTTSDIPTLLFMVEMFKHNLLERAAGSI